MRQRDDLVYDLIFSEKSEFIINVGDYIKDIYKYDEFIDDIKQILIKSKVTIASNSIDVDSNSVTWKLKVKK
jgi:hypothetical protein